MSKVLAAHRSLKDISAYWPPVQIPSTHTNTGHLPHACNPVLEGAETTGSAGSVT